MGEYLDNNKPMGPNVKRLLALMAARIAIPPGTPNPVVAGIDAILNFSDTSRRAMTEVEKALQAIKSAPDNPYGNDDEAIAAAILNGVEERKLKGDK